MYCLLILQFRDMDHKAGIVEKGLEVGNRVSADLWSRIH
jgi:hypothetical protein